MIIRVWASLEIVLHTKQLEAGGHHAHVVGSRMLNSGYTLRRCAVASVRKDIPVLIVMRMIVLQVKMAKCAQAMANRIPQ
jgi:hypothetical protein